MAKAAAIRASYAAIAILSTLLLNFILYIIFAKTPKEMRTYKWLLVNIQISVFVEVFFWTVLMSPIPEVNPVTHFYSVGLWYQAFGTPVKITFAIETCLHCLALSSLLICVSYRYRPLCAFGESWFYRQTVRDGGRMEFFYLYVTSPTIYTILSYFALLTDGESRALILKLDPEHVFVSTVGAFSDDAWMWAIGLILATLVVGGEAIFIVFDSHRILRKKAMNSRTAVLHKEAINALIIQISLMETVSLIASTFLGCILFTSGSNQINAKNGLFDIFLSFACCFYSSKSICCSLAILAHKPYRSAVRNLIWKEQGEATVAPDGRNRGDIIGMQTLND